VRPGIVLQHGPDGPPGILGEWLGRRGIAAHVHETWRHPLPDPAGYRFVVSLGSEHSAVAEHPEWVRDEVAFMRAAIDGGVPVLGLCFGGQALAVALGGAVRPSEPPEVGWLELDGHDGEVPPGPWLLYHFEVFEPPAGAHIHARTPAGPAAFSAGVHTGVQFHPEATPSMAHAWARCEPERLAALGVTPSRLLATGRRAAAVARGHAHVLFDAWWARAQPPSGVSAFSCSRSARIASSSKRK
jgi:GMP synthase-like glutamine amidotransferase